LLTWSPKEEIMAEEQIEEVRQEAVPEKKKGSLLKLIIIILGVLILGGGAGYFFYGRNALAKHGQKPVVKEEKKIEVGPTLALEPFIINVSGSTSRYVKISVAIELENEKAVEETKKISPVIRDKMLTVFASKAPETFLDVNARNGMKKELSDAVVKLFEKKEFKGVYITDIIMQ
jgi:flagellar protein FliL